MDTQLKALTPAKPGLELDLIADFTCPWSFLGKRRLEQALESVYGAPVLALRWHGLRVQESGQVMWQQYLASRLPPGVDVALTERALLEAGAALDIGFRFDLIERVPDTLEAHRFMKLAAREGRQSDLADAVFHAFFEQGRDIGDPKVLADIGSALGVTASVADAFADEAQGRSEVAGEEQRLRSLGVAAVPNLLVNGHILVPGPAEVSTYVQAIDQALFPQLTAPADRHALH
ncbi:MAG TPA: DsbA family oxidoreductase [Steroidobacteraceae bacterium]|nr:DsbA family oxidoreductase [Steroidobacteraceae bacterium]